MNSRPRGLALSAAPAVVAMLALAATGCGVGYSTGSSRHTSAPQATSQARAFAWLHPLPAPPTWHTSQLPNGAARLAYPLRWRSIRSDPGTVTAAVRTRTGDIQGYLNATPRQGEETLSNWSSFRLDHNRDEGDVNVRLVAFARNLRFRGGHGSCVIDAYTSSTGNRYREIACIVAGASATTVVVGAASPAQWPQQRAAIERAISSFLT